MRLQFYVSTISGQWISEFGRNNKFLSDVFYINQSSKTTCKDSNVFNFNERGLSKSRNRAIELADCDYLILTDNDVRYDEQFKENLISSIKESEYADVIWFKQSQKNKYPNKKKFVSFRDSLRCSSIELAYKLDFIKKNHLCFNELFGLGAEFPTGEENIFLFNILKAGGRIYFANFVGVHHEHQSSGQNLFKVESQFAKGALFTELYGKKSILVILIFFLKKIRKFRFSLFALWNMLKGRKKYLELKKYKLV